MLEMIRVHVEPNRMMEVLQCIIANRGCVAFLGRSHIGGVEYQEIDVNLTVLPHLVDELGPLLFMSNEEPSDDENLMEHSELTRQRLRHLG